MCCGAGHGVKSQAEPRRRLALLPGRWAKAQACKSSPEKHGSSACKCRRHLIQPLHKHEPLWLDEFQHSGRQCSCLEAIEALYWTAGSSRCRQPKSSTESRCSTPLPKDHSKMRPSWLFARCSLPILPICLSLQLQKGKWAPA